jgi:adenine-specific DNA methylase
VFRSLLLAEFSGQDPVDTSYWRAHDFHGVIADPFMGGGTPLIEANRLGFHVVGTDINPMAYWVVRQSLDRLDRAGFAAAARAAAADVDALVGDFYRTECTGCGQSAAVKYFLWVKVQACPDCGADNDLFPGYLLAEAERHPRHVLACASCRELNEFESVPTALSPQPCGACGNPVVVDGPARSNRIGCRSCRTAFRYPSKGAAGPPRHRMWAIEYHCEWCKPRHQGRFFKRPDAADLARFERAAQLLAETTGLPIPDEAIPPGDETDRLHRWGYRHYRELFSERQLLGLGVLLQRLQRVSDAAVRHALLTVFSDFLRYQNMLCRYDTYALKCQDVFSVHGFPVGLVQCENNLLGIPRVGSGAFRHFVEKYVRAKDYCAAPFETRRDGKRKQVVPVPGERIEASFVDHFPAGEGRQALLRAVPAASVELPPESLDGVFTDPPYFANVQYAELMDFCYVWLRQGLVGDVAEFAPLSTRNADELTGNATLGRGIEHFTEGLSLVFRRYAGALKAGAPFVFTYHHNDPTAYVPLVVAILDAGLDCTRTVPAAAEMGASLHIAGTGSSVLDTVFVCRAAALGAALDHRDVGEALTADAAAMIAAGVRLSTGDLRCLAAGHLARLAVNQLRSGWQHDRPLKQRVEAAAGLLASLGRDLKVAELVAQARSAVTTNGESGTDATTF